jgi:hypothetical protein
MAEAIALLRALRIFLWPPAQKKDRAFWKAEHVLFYLFTKKDMDRNDLEAARLIHQKMKQLM